MNILLLGADGFIGRHLVEALSAAGHHLHRGVRTSSSVSGSGEVSIDYRHDLTVSAWLPRLAGIEVVINSVGLLRETAEARFDAVHVQAPRVLFEACAESGVQKLIQISALGADEHAASAYHLSKKAADDHLATLDLDWIIVQPAIVYGPDGASSRFFRLLASLPVLFLPDSGEQWIQPIHIDDLGEAIVRLVQPGAPARCRLLLVGPQPVRYRDLLIRLRAQLGLAPAPLLPISDRLLRLAARLGDRIPGSFLTRETLSMLARGNTGNPESTCALLGRFPRSLEHFITPLEAPLLRYQARMDWLLPLLKIAIALVWLGSGIVSLGLYPIAQSLELLEAVGLTGTLALTTLYAASLLDIALGVATLIYPRAWLWGLQLGMVLLYSLIITLCLPGFWLHPFGPLLKNLPILAILLALFYLEER